MERQPSGDQAAESDKGDGNSKPDRSFSFARVPILPVGERPVQRQPESERPQIRLEGIINLRPEREGQPPEDPRLHPGLEAPAESREDDEDDSDDDGSKEAKAKLAAQRQAAARQAQNQPPVHTSQPGVEIVVSATHVETPAEAGSEGSDEQDSAPVPARPVPPLHGFPPVAPRQEIPAPQTVQEATPEQRISETFAHGRAPAAEQADWYGTEDTGDEPIAQQTGPAHPQPQLGAVAPNAAYQPIMAPNVNPYAYANPNYAGQTMPTASANAAPTPQPSATGGGFNQPPVQPGYNQMPPYGPYGPNFSGYSGYNVPPQPNLGPSSPNAAPVMPIERPPIITHNRDPRVGVLSALLGFGYIGRKLNERKARQRMDRMEARQTQLQESIAVDNRLLQERQRQFAAEQQRQTAELQGIHAVQEYAPAAPLAAESQPLPRPFNTAPSGLEQSQAITTPGGFSAHGQERSQPQQARPEIPGPNPIQGAEGQPMEMPDVRVNARPDQHVEHSAWHNIVVDEHGHEVAGAIRYGEGFQRERQQEIIPDRIAASGSVPAGNGSADSSGMIAAGSPMQDQYGNPLHPGVLPGGTTHQSLPQGVHADTNHRLPASAKQPSSLTNPWFWVMLALIVVAFFTAALV